MFKGVKEVGGLAVEEEEVEVEFDDDAPSGGGGVEEREGPVLGRNPGLTGLGRSGLRSFAGGGIDCGKEEKLFKLLSHFISLVSR